MVVCSTTTCWGGLTKLDAIDSVVIDDVGAVVELVVVHDCVRLCGHDVHVRHASVLFKDGSFDGLRWLLRKSPQRVEGSEAESAQSNEAQ